MTSTIQPILDRALAGERLSAEDGVRLLESDELLPLGQAAQTRADQLHPEGLVTFTIDRNINNTNVCVTGCLFCAFYRPPGHPEAYILDQEEILQKVQELVDLGGTSILMQGGMNPECDLAYYEDLFRSIKQRFEVTIHSLSPPEVYYLARLERLSVAETLRRLRDAGLDSLPGGGAEILADSVRRRISPRKVNCEQWLEVMRTAHKLGLRGTATMVYGAGETSEERIEHLLRVRKLQDETGGFTAFIPWSFSLERTELEGRFPEPTGYDYLKLLATSRLMLDNIPNIQASWLTQGTKMGQVALAFGANDLGGIMMEENVLAATGLSIRSSVRELVALIRETGKTPARRDTYYNVLERY